MFFLKWVRSIVANASSLYLDDRWFESIRTHFEKKNGFQPYTLVVLCSLAQHCRKNRGQRLYFVGIIASVELMNLGRLKEYGWPIVFGLLFLFAFYSNIAKAINNYHLGQAANVLSSQVSAERLHNKKLSLLLAYYKSASYQEVQARAQLGMKKDGETTLIVQGVTQPTSSLSDQLDTQIRDESTAKAAPPSNFTRWWQYFFD